MLTRRQWNGGLIATLAALAGGCLTISPSEEQRLGKESAQEVEDSIGLVRDARLVGYVRQVGDRLTRAAPASDATWQFNIADEAEANAFALPGGWVYVTRGALALLNSEDQLAGVLGHEMAHVLERHAARRIAAATPFALLFGVPAGLLGMISPTVGGVVEGTGQLASSVALASYSRDQERDADRRGIELAARAGYDPEGLATFLRTLEREEALQTGRDAGRPRFFSTHPTTPERVGNVETAARALARDAGAPLAAGRAAFLARLEGLVVGDNPAYGVFFGSLFLHPDLDLALDIPTGWKPVVGASGAGAAAPDGDAALVLTVVGAGDDPVAGARKDGLPEGQLKRLQRRQIGALPAAALVADTRDGDRLVLTWIAHRSRVCRLTALARVKDWERYGRDLERVTASVRPQLPADRDRIVESRLRIRRAMAGETVGQMAARAGGPWGAARMAVANGIAADARLEAGWPVKVAVTEQYRGPSTRPWSDDRDRFYIARRIARYTSKNTIAPMTATTRL